MKVVYTKTALKSLAKMQNDIKKLIIQAINNIPNGDIKNMKGFNDNRKRLRVGKYRVIYRIEDDLEIQVLLVLDIGSRGDIYK